MDPFHDDFVASTTPLDGTLTISTLDTGIYGNGFDGTTDRDGILFFEVDSGGRGLILEFETFDVDFAGEIAVYMNGTLVGIAGKGLDGGMGTARVTMDDDAVIDGINELEFVATDASDGTFGITDILLRPEPTLKFGEFNGDKFGNRYGGQIDTDGTVDFQFFFTPTEDLTLYVRGYDIDYSGEVEVFLNGASIGFLEKTANRSLGGSSFDIAREDVISGSNLITFEVQDNVARSWGVTDLIILNQGINVSSMAVDPEFTDDGWVTWMDSTAAYLGRYDLNSGALIEIVNQSTIAPQPINVSLNGPEIIRTTDGVGAIAIADQGLIWVSDDETYILDGTFGYRNGFLPKGITPGLRFTMVDVDSWFTDSGPIEVLLWDNGAISTLDFGDPTTRAVAWLNESEVVCYSDTQVGVFDLDTLQMEWFAEDIYEEGYSAAFESSAGERYIAALTGDTMDIFQDTASGWELLRRIQPPDGIHGPYLLSPEFVEKDGEVYLSALAAPILGTREANAVIVYDIADDAWSQVTPISQIIDPEMLILDNGNAAFYFRDRAAQTTNWVVVEFDDIIASQIPGTPIAVGREVPSPAEDAPAAAPAPSAALGPDPAPTAIRLVEAGTAEPAPAEDAVRWVREATGPISGESDIATVPDADEDSFVFVPAAPVPALVTPVEIARPARSDRV